MGLTQSQAVSTTSTLAGPVCAQLAINIVIRHVINILLYIAGLFRDSRLTFCRGNGRRCIFFSALLIGFCLCLTANAIAASNKHAERDGHQRSRTGHIIQLFAIGQIQKLVSQMRLR